MGFFTPHRFVVSVASSPDMLKDGYFIQRTFRNSDEANKVYDGFKAIGATCVLYEKSDNILRSKASSEEVADLLNCQEVA